MIALYTRFVRATEPSAAAVERLRRRVSPAPAPSIDGGEVDPSALSRLREGVARRQGQRLTRLRWPAGAIALLVVAVVGGRFVSPTAPTVPLSVPLADLPLTVPGGLGLSPAGSGQVGGTSSLPHVHWDVGTLAVNAQGRVVVDTREGLVSGADIDLIVERDRLGTRWTLLRGQAELTCGVEPAQHVGTGDQAFCLPSSAAGWLARARTLQDRAASATDVLGSIDAGLARFDAPPSARAELVAAKVDLLLSQGEREAARATAAKYPNDGPRFDELQHIFGNR